LSCPAPPEDSRSIGSRSISSKSVSFLGQPLALPLRLARVMHPPPCLPEVCGMYGRISLFVSSLALVALMLPSAALAQDPRDVRIADGVSRTLAAFTQLTIFDDVTARVEERTVTLTGKVTMPYKRKDLEARRARENRRTLEEAVVEALLAAHAFQVPDALVLRQVGHQIEHTRERLRQQGVDPDRLPWDYPKLLEEMRPGAERAVRRALLLETIAEKEGLVPGAAEVDAEVERIAQASQRPAAAVRSMMEKSGDLGTLRLSLRESRTLDFLIERAQITS